MKLVRKTELEVAGDVSGGWVVLMKGDRIAGSSKFQFPTSKKNIGLLLPYFNIC